MAKVALITDTHYGVRNDNPVFYTYFQKSLTWFFQTIDTENIRHVLHLGDLLDRRKYLNYYTAYRLRTDFLEPLAQRDIEFYIIPGNHDSYYKNTLLVNAISELVAIRYPNFNTYFEPALINIDGTNIQLIPWINEENYEQSLEAIQKSPAEVLFGHLEIKGFETHKGSPSEVGLETSAFDRYDIVGSGHFHHRSSFRNINYIGAFAEQTWSDYRDPRGFTIFDTETRQLEFHKNPYSLFHMISYDDTKNPKIYDDDFSQYKDCYVKVVVMRKEPSIFEKFMEALHQAGPEDITVVEDMDTNKEPQEQSVDQADDTPTIIAKYVDGIVLPDNIDKNRFKDYMRGIHTEAISVEND